MGGLDRTGVCGRTAPYFANATAEVMFHAPTMMPSNPREPQQVRRSPPLQRVRD
jgi:hypothetical protein